METRPSLLPLASLGLLARLGARLAPSRRLIAVALLAAIWISFALSRDPQHTGLALGLMIVAGPAALIAFVALQRHDRSASRRPLAALDKAIVVLITVGTLGGTVLAPALPHAGKAHSFPTLLCILLIWVAVPLGAFRSR